MGMATSYIFVAEPPNHRICKITPQGQVSTLAGTGEGGHRDTERIAIARGVSEIAYTGGGGSKSHQNTLPPAAHVSSWGVWTPSVAGHMTSWRVRTPPTAAI
jgi:hypothetical protein